MSFLEKGHEWVAKTHPEYADYRIEIMANKFNICESWQEIKNKVEVLLEDSWGDYRDIDEDELEDVIQDVKAPKGFVFITLTKGSDRVCLLIPSNFKEQL